MSFMLRTTDEDDEMLNQLAGVYNTSRQQAVLRASREALERAARQTRYVEARESVIDRYTDTIKRLADS